jgi:hypothetical protein
LRFQLRAPRIEVRHDLIAQLDQALYGHARKTSRRHLSLPGTKMAKDIGHSAFRKPISTEIRDALFLDYSSPSPVLLRVTCLTLTMSSDVIEDKEREPPRGEHEHSRLVLRPAHRLVAREFGATSYLWIVRHDGMPRPLLN